MRPRCCASCWLDYLCFNPRICKRCDPKAFLRASGLISFNPRICKRCDIPSPSSYLKSKVSIHASVKDATAINVLGTSMFSFNPRICKRCDTDLGRITPVFTVSIHASVKDATLFLLSLNILVNLFQSTHL